MRRGADRHIGNADGDVLRCGYGAGARGKEKKTVKKAKAKEVTLAEIRAVLAEKSTEGHTAEVKELLAKYGADKLSEVDAPKYAELKAEVKVLGDG